MHWGNSLLFLGDLLEGLLDMLAGVYNAIHDLIWNVLYLIWMLIAWIVDAIEVVFRKLAGLNVDGEDLVTRIINNPAVKTIFGNLVGFATAMMIFFTIVKILQDHYKEKDGGNPYKIVLRTFKGMLMFTFVGVAVSVGLYATGVVFRGLDAATSGGSASIGGQIFKAMAAEANRKEKGQLTDGGVKSVTNYFYNKHWNRMAAEGEGGSEYGKYVLIKVTDNNTTGTQAELRERYMKLSPEYQYGIVNEDGSVSPIAPYLKSLSAKSSDSATKDEMKDYFNSWYGDTDEGEGWNENNNWTDKGDGQISGTGGYKNDILEAISLNITPSIDLTWSPIDIKNYTYEMKLDGDPIQYDINIMVLGSGINISFKIEKVKYWKTHETEKSLEESAKQFGISMNGSVGLQDGEASASFNLEMFHPDMFMGLLQSIIVNICYTNLMQTLLEALPTMWVVYTAGPITLNLVQLFSPLVLELTQQLIDVTVGEMVPIAMEPDPDKPGELREVTETIVNEDGTSKEVPVKMVEPFRYVDPKNGNTSNRGVWVDVNNKATSMPFVIEKYIIDGNFEELWSQLTDNWNDFVDKMNEKTANTYETYDENKHKIDETNQKIKNQSEWGTYKTLVDKYNDYAKSQLGQLGNLLGIYEQVMEHDTGLKDDIEKANAVLDGTDDWNIQYKLGPLYEEGNLDDLKQEIKNIFVNLVSYYNSTVSSSANKKPSNNYADTVITPAIHKPIIELKYSNSGAGSNTIDAKYIWDLFMNPKGKNANKIKFNMYVDTGIDGAYASRQIDWSAYGPKFWGEFNNIVADIYFDKEITSAMDEKEYPKTDNANQPSMSVKQSLNQMKYIQLNTGYTQGNRIGAGYFFHKGEGPLFDYTGKGKIINYTGYWGNRGVTVQDYRYYQAYDGHTLVLNNDNNYWGPKGSTDIISSSMPATTSEVNASTVSNDSVKTYTSSATSNALSQAGRLDTMNQIAALADVSEEKSELATKFSKNIIRFRKLNTAADGKPTLKEEQETDKAVLKDWVDTQSVAAAPVGALEYPLARMTPADIDNAMAAGPGQRHYLMLTREGLSGPDANGNYGSFIGMFSYKNILTVNALYDMGDMNYIIGYIAMVSALGVYLNFAFGLIKRAVNMSVLYIMSPISIAFYPFDDGSKFNQQFVSPFYKEAISAFAVIVSLNIFILLLSPVQKAVEGVLGGVTGWIGGWLALVAFTSMLPGIRDTICSVLGASKMESKGLGQMIDDAANNLTTPFKGLKSNTVSKARKKFHDIKDKVRDGVGALGKATGLSSKLEGLKKSIGDSKFGQKMKEVKDKYDNSKVGKLANTAFGTVFNRQSDKRINDAIAKGDKSGLSAQERARYNKLQKKAKEALGPDATDAEIKAKMTDKKFQDSVPSVVKKVNSIGKGALKTAAKAAGAFALAGPAGLAMVAGKGVGKLKDKFAKGLLDTTHRMRGTAVGEILNDFVKNKKGDKNSIFGSRLRHADDAEQAEIWKKISEDWQKDEDKRRKAEKDGNTGFERDAANTAEGNRIIGEAVQKRIDTMSRMDAAEEIAKGVGQFKVLEAMYADEYKRKDPKMSDELALKKAQDDLMEKYCDKDGEVTNEKALREEFEKQNGLEYAKNVLFNGGKFGAYSLDSDDGKSKINEYKAKHEVDRRAMIQELQELCEEGSKGLKVKLDADINTALCKNVSNGMIEALRFDNEEDKKKAEELVEKNKTASKEELTEIFKAEFEGKTANGVEITSQAIATAIEAQSRNINNMHNQDEYVANLKIAQEAADFFEKGAQLMNSKIGDLASAGAVDAVAKALENLRDVNINSANLNSLGAKYREIEADTTLNAAEKEAKKAMAKQNMQLKYDQLRTEFYHDEGLNILKYKATKDARENMRHAEAMHMANAAWEQIEFKLNVETQQAVRQTIINDGLVQDMLTSGDPNEGALKMQKVAYAVKSGDMDTAYSLGMDKETVDKMLEWQNTGKGQYVDQVSSLAGTFASFLGSMDNPMGGDTIAGAMSALTNTFQVAMAKQFTDALSTAANAAAAEESRANESLTQFLSELDTMCNSKNWKESFSKGLIKTLDGSAIQSTQEMREVVDGLVNDIRAGKKSYDSTEVTHFIDMITQVRDTYPEDKTIFEETKDMLNAFAKANVQLTKGKEYFEKNTLLSKFSASIQEKTAKMTERK